jgi:hypothetical protein
MLQLPRQEIALRAKKIMLQLSHPLLGIFTPLLFFEDACGSKGKFKIISEPIKRRRHVAGQPMITI